MREIIIALIFYTVWGIADLWGLRVIFDKFQVLRRARKHNYNYFWVVYYFVITFIYCIVKYYPVHTMAVNLAVDILFFAFYLRVVPFIWSAYGINAKAPAVVFFYEECEAVISSSLTLMAVNALGVSLEMHTLIDDSFMAIISVAFALILYVLLYCKRNQLIDIGLADLSVWNYIALIALIFCTGNLETVVWYRTDSIRGRVYVTLVMLLVLVLTMMYIFINERNFSLGNVIGVLKQQMKDLTEYYQELVSKEKELRKIRHDTKNHMQAVYSLIETDRKQEALEYLEKIDKKYQMTSRQFDTGNFIADALLSSKVRDAEKHDTEIFFEGVIPSAKIDDVDIVTLLSNMLDNALEACEKSEGSKKIIIESRFKEPMWVLTMKNPVSGPVDIEMNHVVTTKPDIKLHGIGISNMEQVVRKYHGIIRLECEDDQFTVRAGLELK